jgi:hypothetical protein
MKFNRLIDVRFGSKADICAATSHVRFTPNSDHESGRSQNIMSALPPKADMCGATRDVRFGPKADIGGPLPEPLGHDGPLRVSLPVRSLRQLRTHSVQGAVRVHETELSRSVVSVANLTETTLDSATGPLRSDGIGI